MPFVRLHGNRLHNIMHHDRSAFSPSNGLVFTKGVVGQILLVPVCSVNSYTGLTVQKLRLDCRWTSYYIGYPQVYLTTVSHAH